jgi:hypothetical protein
MERLATVAERLRDDFARVFAEPPPPSIKKSCERMIEDLLAVMDACDDDPDLEETGDDEPSLGFACARVGMGFPNQPEPGQWDWPSPNEDVGDDREAEDEHDEPSLGSVYNGSESISQASWAAGADDDRELADDGEEGDGDVDDEQSLGSFDRMENQEHAWLTKGDVWWAGQDIEADPTEGHAHG